MSVCPVTEIVSCNWLNKIWEILLLKDSQNGLISSSYCPPCSSTTKRTNGIKVESFILRMNSSPKDAIEILTPTKAVGES